jgi:hypothetical protein
MQRPVAAFLIVTTTLEAFNRSSLAISILVICARQGPFGPCATVQVYSTQSPPKAAKVS